MHDWQYFFNDVDNSLNEGVYRIFEPEWKAEILHWFSREDVGKKQKEEFIKALIDFDDRCGKFYRYRAYFLACEALAKFPDCSLSDRIVEQLLRWSYAYFRQDKRDWQILPEPLVKTARATLELTDKKRVVAAFVQLVHTTESRTIMRIAADKLGQLDPGNKSAIAALFFLKPPAEDTPTFSQISHTQEEISVDENAIAAVIDTIETTVSKEICYHAIASLREIAYGNQTAIATLEKFLQINQGDRICFEAATTLWKIDPGNVAALKALVYILETTADAHLLDCAATYLLEIDPGNKAAIVALLEVIENSSAKSLCRRAAFHLGEFEPGNKVAISTLYQILENTQHPILEDEWEHFYAATTLWKIDPGNVAALKALVYILETTADAHLLDCAAAYLLEIDPGNKAAIVALLEVIENSSAKSLCRRAAFHLVEFDPGNKVAISTLYQILENTQHPILEDEWEHFYAAQNLVKIDPGNLKAIATLCQIRENSQHEWINLQAAKSLENAVQNLEQLDLSNKSVKDKLNEVIPILIRFVQTFQQDDNKHYFDKPTTQLYYESCLFIAQTLTKILQSEHLPQVVITLKEYLSEKFYKNSSYRYEAVFNIIWHCAENMTYPEFYKAWHS